MSVTLHDFPGFIYLGRCGPGHCPFVGPSRLVRLLTNHLPWRVTDGSTVSIVVHGEGVIASYSRAEGHSVPAIHLINDANNTKGRACLWQGVVHHTFSEQSAIDEAAISYGATAGTTGERGAFCPAARPHERRRQLVQVWEYATGRGRGGAE